MLHVAGGILLALAFLAFLPALIRFAAILVPFTLAIGLLALLASCIAA